MQHLNFEQEPSNRAIRRLAQRLRPATVRELAWVMEADASGRPPLSPEVPEGTRAMLEAAEANAITDEAPRALVMGRDVMPYFKGVAGPHIGQVTKEAFEAQLNGDISTPEDAQSWLADRLRQPMSMLSESYLRELAAGTGPLALRARGELERRRTEDLFIPPA
jgi:hypothetical protein